MIISQYPSLEPFTLLLLTFAVYPSPAPQLSPPELHTLFSQFAESWISFSVAWVILWEGKKRCVRGQPIYLFNILRATASCFPRCVCLCIINLLGSRGWIDWGAFLKQARGVWIHLVCWTPRLQQSAQKIALAGSRGLGCLAVGAVEGRKFHSSSVLQVGGSPQGRHISSYPALCWCLLQFGITPSSPEPQTGTWAPVSSFS